MKLELPLVALAVVSHAIDVVRAENMNGPHYVVSNSESFQEDYDDTREFFDVYSNPIRTLYSQVHWVSHGDLPLPDHIIQRFAGGKAMAITGYEVDQVMIDEALNERSVPITWAYNHHYMAFILNSKTSRLTETKVTESSRHLGMNHGASTNWKVQIFDEDTHDLPQAHFFSEGNGGEMRMSYHGYPKGYAQVVQSPDLFHIIPMQIDTWNREMANATYIPGPMPRASKIPSSAGYNGLIECPCSDRLPKDWHMTYKMDPSGGSVAEPVDGMSSCSQSGNIANATECFSAAHQVFPATQYTTKAVRDTSFPQGCTVSLASDGAATAVWNTIDTAIPQATTETKGFVGIAAGVVNVTISVKPWESSDAVQITLVGPSHSWFGIGFGTTTMCLHLKGEICDSGGPYAIIVIGEEVQERKLDFHGPGTVLDRSVNVLDNIVEGGIRTVRLSRKLEGANDKYMTFEPSDRDLDVILATGCDMKFAQHCGHGSSHITFVSVDSPVTLCQAGIKGSIGGTEFTKQCDPYPRSDLLVQQNPSCWIQTYEGGLSCCRHNNFLLDSDQEIPWSDQPLEYRLKFRFYFEDFQIPSPVAPASHKNLVRIYVATEAGSGEYDVPQCSEGTVPSQCVHTISARVKVVDLLFDCSTVDSSYCTGKGSRSETETAGIELIYAGPHCHAPSCLSLELYNADTGTVLCRVEPTYGKSHNIYDEEGFLTLPPCLWGNMADGLEPPVLLSLNTTLLSIKRNNNSIPHTGEMASWQMRGVVVPKEKEPSIDLKQEHPLLRNAAADHNA